MEIITVKALNFRYPGENENSLKDINLGIESGSFTLLCGKSGSGKTTLLRHMKPVLAPHGKLEGEVLFKGRALSELSLRDQSSRIGYVMQNPDEQIVTDKVWHELAFGLESLGCEQKEMRLRVAEMASYFGMQELFHRDTSGLSGGQKQLLNLASVMAMQPEVLILDEPTAQLDPIAAADFLNTLRAINRDFGTTIILSEHRLEEIYYAADRVVVMEEGRIIANNSPRNTAASLKDIGSEMCLALPTPVRVWQALEKNTADCPLTVREGKQKLLESTDARIGEKIHIEDAFDDDFDETPALEIKEIWYRYSKDEPDVLRGVNFRLPKGKLCAVVGGNGAGKSTLLRAVCGICPPYRGKIKFDGKKMTGLRNPEPLLKKPAMLPQDPKSLFAKKTVLEELEEMSENAGEIANTVQLCHLDNLLERHPFDLSGGEQQRCALAKVLLTQPDILLLDEPTKGFDGFFKLEFAAILKALTGKGISIMMVSHDLEFCAHYADTVSMFFDGQILTTETPHRFFGHNCFYTTAAARMSRDVFTNAVTAEDIIDLCRGTKA